MWTAITLDQAQRRLPGLILSLTTEGQIELHRVGAMLQRYAAPEDDLLAPMLD